MEKFKAVDDCIASFPREVQILLQKVRQTIQSTAPDATETINYGIPTYKLRGKNLIHFCGFTSHIGLYPGPQAIEHFSRQLEKYKTSKGTIQFPFDKPIPYGLIKKITKYKVANINS